MPESNRKDPLSPSGSESRGEGTRLVDNAPILSLHHDGLTIEGYSRAAVQTYWRIPELKIGFDLGAQPWDFMGTPTWFVTHAHLDHVAALPVYVARRRMMRTVRRNLTRSGSMPASVAARQISAEMA